MSITQTPSRRCWAHPTCPIRVLGSIELTFLFGFCQGQRQHRLWPYFLSCGWSCSGDDVLWKLKRVLKMSSVQDKSYTLFSLTPPHLASLCPSLLPAPYPAVLDVARKSVYLSLCERFAFLPVIDISEWLLETKEILITFEFYWLVFEGIFWPKPTWGAGTYRFYLKKYQGYLIGTSLDKRSERKKEHVGGREGKL